jgi:hypothetical protein
MTHMNFWKYCRDKAAEIIVGVPIVIVTLIVVRDWFV